MEPVNMDAAEEFDTEIETERPSNTVSISVTQNEACQSTIPKSNSEVVQSVANSTSLLEATEIKIEWAPKQPQQEANFRKDFFSTSLSEQLHGDWLTNMDDRFLRLQKGIDEEQCQTVRLVPLTPFGSAVRHEVETQTTAPAAINDFGTQTDAAEDLEGILRLLH